MSRLRSLACPVICLATTELQPIFSIFLLKNNAVFIEALNKQEQELTNAKLYYLPTEKLETLKHQIKNGDIFGITTTVDGLDITHVGIAAFKGDEFHFLHASSKAGKVILSEETRVEYLLNRKPSTGIMIARPFYSYTINHLSHHLLFPTETITRSFC